MTIGKSETYSAVLGVDDLSASVLDARGELGELVGGEGGGGLGLLAKKRYSGFSQALNEHEHRSTHLGEQRKDGASSVASNDGHTDLGGVDALRSRKECRVTILGGIRLLQTHTLASPTKVLARTTSRVVTPMSLIAKQQ